MGKFKEVPVFFDAFGEDVLVDDTVHFISYGYIARGTVTKITFNDEAYREEDKWGIFIKKEEGLSHAFERKANESRLRIRKQIARVW